MDDATRQFLIDPRIRPLRVPFSIDKAQVLEITAQLLDRNDLTGTLRDTFDAYVGACMEYNMQRVAVPTVQNVHYPCDNLLLPPKRLATFVVRKNVRVVHGSHATHATLDTEERGLPQDPLLAGNGRSCTGNVSANKGRGNPKNAV